MGTGFKVWFTTGFLNAFYFTFACVAMGRYLDILWSFVIFLVGSAALLPSMLIFLELLKPGKGKQYGPAARIALLTFATSGQIILLCALLNLAAYGRFGIERQVAVLAGTAIAALITAVLLCRQSLLKVAMPPPPSIPQ